MSPTVSRFVFGLVAVVCVVAQALLLRSVLRAAAPAGYEDDRRKNPRRGDFRWGPDRRAPQQDGSGRQALRTELAWVVIPALGLAALLYLCWTALPR